jgi:hypothetical protein
VSAKYFVLTKRFAVAVTTCHAGFEVPGIEPVAPIQLPEESITSIIPVAPPTDSPFFTKNDLLLVAKVHCPLG